MSLPKPNLPAASPCRRGPACQQGRREAEYRARRVILDFRNRMTRQDATCSEAARCLGLAPRTLRHWNRRFQDNRLKPYARGRPIRRSLRSLRNQVVGFLRCTGPHIGMTTLQAEFPTMPHGELKDMLRRFRRVWQYQNQRLIHRLRWHHPGTVWAADHVQPDRPVDGKYPYILSVRDLASHYQLAWQPVSDVGADTTAAVLSSLMWKHGPPLVLKTDNGPGFIAWDTRKLLATWSILHLRNPARTPQYNGSCEAANGSQKNTTEDQAALAGHPGRWTSKDLQRARLIRNRYGRPWGHRGPTPEERWKQSHVTAFQRRQLQATVNRYRKEELAQRGIPDEVRLSDAAQASVDRVAISRALRRHDYLRVTRRLVTPSIAPGARQYFHMEHTCARS
jgi:hypothetical protein